MRLLLFIFIILLSANANALQEPTAISTDERIREVPYNENDIFHFRGHYGYQSSIEFEEGEDIKTISVGDSVAWQIVPSGNRIFIKPIEPDPDTNMTVVTNKRVYHFEIHGDFAKSMRDPNMMFVMRFIYPGQIDLTNLNTKESVPHQDMADNPNKYNFNYTISGTERISPIRIFDDGEFTYFQFNDINADIPAFFKVDSETRESIINYRTVGDYVVIERVASMFTLRHGSDVVCVFNESRPLDVKPEIMEKLKEGRE